MLRICSLFLLILLPPQSVLAASLATCKTHRVVYYNNTNTKVWATTICPEQFLPYHTHQTARVLIPQQNGLLAVVYKSGGHKYIKLKKNVPLLLPRSEGIKPHRDINIGKQPINVIVVEIKSTAYGKM